MENDQAVAKPQSDQGDKNNASPEGGKKKEDAFDLKKLTKEQLDVLINPEKSKENPSPVNKQDGKISPEVEEMRKQFQAQTDERIRGMQSVYDKRIASVEADFEKKLQLTQEQLMSKLPVSKDRGESTEESDIASKIETLKSERKTAADERDHDKAYSITDEINLLNRKLEKVRDANSVMVKTNTEKELETRIQKKIISHETEALLSIAPKDAVLIEDGHKVFTKGYVAELDALAKEENLPTWSAAAVAHAKNKEISALKAEVVTLRELKARVEKAAAEGHKLDEGEVYVPPNSTKSGDTDKTKKKTIKHEFRDPQSIKRQLKDLKLVALEE